MNRRDFLRRSALAGAGLALSQSGWGQALAGGLPSSPLQPNTCLWGAFAMPVGGQNAMEALVAMEGLVGRRMAVHRNYQGMDADILSKDEEWLFQRGTISYRSFHAWKGPQRYAIQWRNIAAGQYDVWLKKQASDLAAWGHKMYICFHHEPEDDTTGNPASQTYHHMGCGTPAEFKDAYNHVRAIFSKAPNLVWLVALLAPTFLGNNGGTKAWMPRHLDMVGVDGYNRYPCVGSKYKSFTDKFAPARAYAKARGKPLAIPEWGCVEQNGCKHRGDPLGKAKWINDSVSIMKTWPDLKWVSYSHEVDVGPLNFRVDTSSSSLSAFTAAGHDPHFN